MVCLCITSLYSEHRIWYWINLTTRRGPQIGTLETVHSPEINSGHTFRVIYGQDLTYLMLTCEADLTGDSLLDSSDITAFVGLFNAQALEADRNSDGVLNFFDIAAYLADFGQPCG